MEVMSGARVQKSAPGAEQAVRAVLPHGLQESLLSFTGVIPFLLQQQPQRNMMKLMLAKGKKP